MITDALQVSRTRKIEEVVEKAHVKDPVWGFVWYFLGLPLILSTASFTTWGSVGVALEFLPMIGLVTALYISVWVNRHQSNNHRSYQAVGLSVFYTTIGFLGIVSILALTRLYYSRSFLLTAYILMVAWVVVGMICFRKRHNKYLVINGGIANRLRGLKKLGWNFIHDYREAQDKIGYDGIVIDLHAHKDLGMLNALADSSLQGIPVKHAASVLEQYSGRTNLDFIAHEGLYNLAQNNPYRFIKRGWEFGLILLFSPIILPLMALVSVAIKIDSKGPVLFTQERVGKDGDIFTLYKFRSMRTDAEANGAQFADKNDSRITRLGKFIRKFRIDELPQFWNVLKGDMSLVGPRPEQEDFVNYFNEEIPFYSYRHKVRPGITGWAQVKGGYAANLSSTEKKLEYDLYYVKNLSLSLDLLVVYATVKTILTGFGSR